MYKRFNTEFSGGIIAHDIGLKKKITLIAFMHKMLIMYKNDLRTCIVVCPANNVMNWKKKWEEFMPDDRKVNIFVLYDLELNQDWCEIVQDWNDKVSKC